MHYLHAWSATRSWVQSFPCPRVAAGGSASCATTVREAWWITTRSVVRRPNGTVCPCRRKRTSSNRIRTEVEYEAKSGKLSWRSRCGSEKHLLHWLSLTVGDLVSISLRTLFHCSVPCLFLTCRSKWLIHYASMVKCTTPTRLSACLRLLLPTLLLEYQHSILKLLHHFTLAPLSLIVSPTKIRCGM